MTYSFEDSIIKINAVSEEKDVKIHYHFNIDNELHFVLEVDKNQKIILLKEMKYKNVSLTGIQFKDSIIHLNINILFNQLSDNLSDLIFSYNRKVSEYKEIIKLILKLKYLNKNSFLKEFETLNDIKDDTSILFKIHNNMLYIMNIGRISYLLSITNRLTYTPNQNELLVSKVKSYDFKDLTTEYLEMVKNLYDVCNLETFSFIYNELKEYKDEKVKNEINKNFLSLIN